MAPYKCMEVLGNKLRTQIIILLKEKERTVQEICKTLGKEQSLVSHSLQRLRECSFVDYKKKGKQSIYFLKSDIFTRKKNKTLFELIEEHATKHCGYKSVPVC